MHTANDNKSTYSSEASTISATRCEQYRRRGPRDPRNAMWSAKQTVRHVEHTFPRKMPPDRRLPRGVHIHDPERYDSSVRYDNQYYRQVYKLNRHMQKLNDRIGRPRMPHFHRPQPCPPPPPPPSVPPTPTDRERMRGILQAVDKISQKTVKRNRPKKQFEPRFLWTLA